MAIISTLFFFILKINLFFLFLAVIICGNSVSLFFLLTIHCCYNVKKLSSLALELGTHPYSRCLGFINLKRCTNLTNKHPINVCDKPTHILGKLGVVCFLTIAFSIQMFVF